MAEKTKTTKKALSIYDAKDWNDVCKIKGTDPIKCLPYPEASDDYQKVENASFQISVIRQLLNDGKTQGSYQYYPWFLKVVDKSKPSGFGLSFDGYALSSTDTSVPSRHLFNSSDDARFAGKTFIKLYEVHQLIIPKH